MNWLYNQTEGIPVEELELQVFLQKQKYGLNSWYFLAPEDRQDETHSRTAFFQQIHYEKTSHCVNQTVLEYVKQIVWFTFHLKDTHSQSGYNAPHFS